MALALLERLCKSGYQFCVLDTRGDYLDFHAAVVFGTLDNPPAPEEVLTALEKPDVSAVVCLAAVPTEERAVGVPVVYRTQTLPPPGEGPPGKPAMKVLYQEALAGAQ